MHQSRSKYLRFLSGLIHLQSAGRALLVRQSIQKKLVAITKMQSYARMYICRKHWLTLRSSAIVLQRAYRVHKLCAKENCAARCLQKYYRLRLQQQKQRKLAKQHAAAKVIQSWFRVWRASQAVKSYYSALSTSVLTVQRIYRGVLARKRVNRMKKAVLTIQSFYRGWVIRKSQTNQAIRDACLRVNKINVANSQSPTIRQKLPVLLDQLLHSKYLSTAADILKSLGKISIQDVNMMWCHYHVGKG